MLSVIVIAALLASAPIAPAPLDRIAFSNDGNFHDRDDIGASAMMQALLWRAGARDRVVYVEHSSHLGENSQTQHFAMKVSAETHADDFGIGVETVFDIQLDQVDATRALAREIQRSAPGRRLVFFQAGPWEAMARAFDRADPSRHRFVKIISHSDWNDDHAHLSAHRDRWAFFAQYEVGGVFEGFAPPSFERIDDQNEWAFKSAPSLWSWLADDDDLAFVLQRTLASGSAAGDMSDAGMVFYYLTGIEHPTMADIRGFLE